MTTTRLKNCRKVLPGVSPLENTLSYLSLRRQQPVLKKVVLSKLAVAHSKVRLPVLSVLQNQKKSYGELFEAAVPVALTVEPIKFELLSVLSEIIRRNWRFVITLK